MGIVRGEGGGLGWEQSFVMWTIDTSHASSQNAAERVREDEGDRVGFVGMRRKAAEWVQMILCIDTG